MEKVMKPPLSSKQRSEVACTKRSAVVPERGSEGPPLSRAAFRGRNPDEDTWSGASCLQGSMVATSDSCRGARGEEEKEEKVTLDLRSGQPYGGGNEKRCAILLEETWLDLARKRSISFKSW
jgi:hypothetical protein